MTHSKEYLEYFYASFIILKNTGCGKLEHLSENENLLIGVTMTSVSIGLLSEQAP